MTPQFVVSAEEELRHLHCHDYLQGSDFMVTVIAIISSHSSSACRSRPWFSGRPPAAPPGRRAPGDGRRGIVQTRVC
jgi:hypothetical protein